MLVRWRLTTSTTPPPVPGGPVILLVGGVSELFQSDLDLGRLAIEQLQREQLGPGVMVEEFFYGAVAVAQRLQEICPEALVLVSAVQRGRPPGTVERRRVEPPPLSPAEVQAAVGDAVTGYVHPDLVVEVAAGLGVLPQRTVAVEVEPEFTGSGEGMSEPAQSGLRLALRLVRAEIRRAPLLGVAEHLTQLLADNRLEPSQSRDVLQQLLTELTLLDRAGRWGQTFAFRDRFRLALAGHVSSAGMDHQDWALWWALLEELDRLEAAEAVTGTPDLPDEEL